MVFGKGEATIVSYLAAQKEPNKSYNALKKFLQLRPGDRIALKSDGSPKGKKPYLHIVGYAEVVGEDDEDIYNHDPDELGHLVKVDFLEVDISKELKRGGYGRTIHQVTRQEHIKEVFGVYSTESINVPAGPSQTGGQGSTRKNVQVVQVRSVRSYVKGAYHNQIQQSLYEQLRQEHGKAAVRMEVNFVDIRVEDSSTVTLYEVKPFTTAKECVRAALGQLLEYSNFVRIPAGKSVRLVAVGPAKPTKVEQSYFRYLSEVLIVPFEYKQHEP